MAEFFATVTTIEKRKIKVVFTAEEKPKDHDAVHEMLNNEEYDDVTDEETVEILSVEEVEYHSSLDEELAEEEEDT